MDLAGSFVVDSFLSTWPWAPAPAWSCATWCWRTGAPPAPLGRQGRTAAPAAAAADSGREAAFAFNGDVTAGHLRSTCCAAQHRRRAVLRRHLRAGGPAGKPHHRAAAAGDRAALCPWRADAGLERLRRCAATTRAHSCRAGPGKPDLGRACAACRLPEGPLVRVHLLAAAQRRAAVLHAVDGGRRRRQERHRRAAQEVREGAGPDAGAQPAGLPDPAAGGSAGYFGSIVGDVAYTTRARGPLGR